MTRVGTATSLALAPTTGTKLVGDEFSMSLRDEFGVLVEAASWETSDPAVISVSTDDPPLLTAVGAGTTTITATKNALSATATVAVVAGDSLPDGTVKWSIEHLGTQPISVNTVDSEGPATFTSTLDAGFWTVNAISADGRHLWTEAAPGPVVMADHAGALVAFTGSSTGLARFAGPEDALPWRHQATGTLLTHPSQAPDGTIYVIDHQPATSPRGTPSTDAIVLAIDGDTGGLKYRYALPRSRFVYDSIFPDALANGCTQPPEEYGASYSAPVIGSDGRAYVTVGAHDVHVNRRWINNACVDTLVEYDSRIELIALSASGAVTTLEVLSETNDACSEVPSPKQVLPDGGSGILITAVTHSQCSPYENDDVAYKTLVVDSAGAVATFASTPGFTIAMTSDTGTAYLLPTIGGNVVAKDMATWTTKFTAPVAGAPLVPLADDGVMLRGNDGLVFVDGNGVVTSTTPLAIQDLTSVRQGEFQGTNAGTVENVSTTTIPIEARSYFEWPFGSKSKQRKAQFTCPQTIPYSFKWKNVAPGSTVTYSFDGPNWTPERKFEVIVAFDLWSIANSNTPLQTSFVELSGSGALLSLRNELIEPDDNGNERGAMTSTTPPNIAADGTLLKATITWNTNQSILSRWNEYRKTSLHEIGHTLGLGDNLNGTKGSSVMNLMAGPHDKGGLISMVVTACDADAAALSPLRLWSPQ